MSKINRDQIKMLHVLRAKLRMSEEDYRTTLQSYGVLSSTELSASQAVSLLTALETKAIALGVWKKYPRDSKRRGRSGQEGLRTGDGRVDLEIRMATPDQINMLDAMWKQVSRSKDDASRKRAFNLFIHRRFHRGSLLMVEESLVHKIVRALEAMGAVAT